MPSTNPIYTLMRNSARDLLARFGVEVTLRKVTTEYNAETGIGTETSADTSFNALSRSRSPQYTNFKELPHFERDGVFATAEDVLVMEYKEGVEPTEGDSILMGEVPDQITSRVVATRTIAPGGLTIIYQVGIVGQ